MLLYTRPFDFLATAILIGLSTYRVARFIASDKLIETQRAWIVVKLVTMPSGEFKKRGFKYKLGYLIGCEFCIGIWVSLILTFFFAVSVQDVDLLSFAILWLGSAGIQTRMIVKDE